MMAKIKTWYVLSIRVLHSPLSEKYRPLVQERTPSPTAIFPPGSVELLIIDKFIWVSFTMSDDLCIS